MAYEFFDYAEWVPQRIAELRLQKGVSARDMSLSLGQSESYINKIENRRTLPSLTGLFYICDFFRITPKDFFDKEVSLLNENKELHKVIERLSPKQTEYILQLVKDLVEK